MQRTSKKSSRKKTGAPQRWQFDGEAPRISSEIQRMEYVSQCARWLRTAMDHETGLPMSANLHPIHHHHQHMDHSGVQQQQQQQQNVVLNAKSYTSFPMSPNVQMACTFCHKPVHATQCAASSHKNMYTRLCWLPVCDLCVSSEKAATAATQ